MDEWFPYMPAPATRGELPFDYGAVATAQRSGELREIGVALRRAGLHPTALRDELGLSYPNRLELEGLCLPDALPRRALVAAFFVAGREADCDALRARGVPIETLLRLGMLKEHSGVVTPRVSCLPIATRLLLCETPDRRAGHHLVAAPDRSADLLLAQVGVREGSWLDLATGTGAIGLVGASGPLLGSDLNDRALAFAQASSWLSGCRDARWCRGDLFGDLPKGDFRTLTFNPPLVEIEDRDRDEDLPLYVAGRPGLWDQFWSEAGAWVSGDDAEVWTHSVLPEDPDYPRSLGLPGAFTVAPFTLGSEGDVFCITRWRPQGRSGLLRLPVSRMRGGPTDAA